MHFSLRFFVCAILTLVFRSELERASDLHCWCGRHSRRFPAPARDSEARHRPPFNEARGWRAVGSAVARCFALSVLIVITTAGLSLATPISYTFSFMGAGVVADGTLLTNAMPDPSAPYPDGYDIVGISGFLDGASITGLLGGSGLALYSPDGFFIYNNIFYPSDDISASVAFFDLDGLLFTTADNDFNLYYDDDSYIDYADGGSGITVAFTAAQSSSIPEPSTVDLLGAALIGLLLIRRMSAPAVARINGRFARRFFASPVTALLPWSLRRAASCYSYSGDLRRVTVAALDPGVLSGADGSRRGAAPNDILKRILDISASLLLLVLTLPVLLVAAIAIRLDSTGPIFYTQERVGLRGKRFVIYKLRTMRIDAEFIGGPQWASLNDARVTRIGGFLRRMRIDELPQILNVLKGEMSFVGPRPERPSFVRALAQAIPRYAERHCARPGITGWAQINHPYGASIEDAREKLAYDLYYIRNSSIIFDLLIILATPKAIFLGGGGR
jgi:lipopolysaccharide/colanic/teichoic acid biosynthesis glycosyltransferase